MKLSKKIVRIVILIIVIAIVCVIAANANSLTPTYSSLNIPRIDSSFKTWMPHRAITNRSSQQYKFIQEWAWSDSSGFMRVNAERDLGINDDYYVIALGSYYGTVIGAKYKITTDTDRVFYGVLGDCKADVHTNRTNQYCPNNNNIVEFIVDISKLDKDVRKMGNANVYSPLNGKILKIEVIDFVLS